MKRYCIGIILLGILCSNPAIAEDENLQLNGTLVEPPPCSLDEDGTVEISFGQNVGIKKVSSGVYRQPIVFNMVCEKTALDWKLALTFYGQEASFDADHATLRTEQFDDLGVKIYAKGIAMPVNQTLIIDGQSLPSLEAVLIKKDGSELEDGEFTATATARVEYQ